LGQAESAIESNYSKSILRAQDNNDVVACLFWQEGGGWGAAEAQQIQGTFRWVGPAKRQQILIKRDNEH
jgi:hypothetical protein